MVPNYSRLVVFICMLVFAPGNLCAQTFAALRLTLKPGTPVVVTDRAGRKTRGKVEELSSTALVLKIREKGRDPDGREYNAWTGRETFNESTITEIRTADGLGNGVAIGLGLGVGLGYLAAVGVSLGVESLGAPMLTWVGASVGGALIGAQIDASRIRGPVVYAPRQNAHDVRIIPALRKSGGSVLVSMRF